MQRKFLTNLGLILTLNLLIKPVFIFGIDRNIQNVVGEIDYGFYYVVLNFSFLFSILLDLGITNFNNRNIAQSSHLLSKHFSGILVLKFLLAILYILVTFFVAILMKYNSAQLKLLALLALNQFLASFILYVRSNISGILSFKTDSVLSVLDRFLMIIFCGVLLYGHITTTKFRIEWFVYSQTAAYSITALTGFFIVLRKAHFMKLNWNWPFFIMIIKRSYPFALLVLLMSFYNRLDPVMLEKLLPEHTGNEQVGIYAKGFRLLDAANNIAYLFAVLLIPIFSRMLKKKESIEHMLKLAFTLVITIAVIVAAGCISYSYEIMDLLYYPPVGRSAAVFRLLMGGFVAVSTTYIFGTLLTANGSLRELNIISCCSLIINFVINLILIPRLLAIGSAYASLATQFFTAIVQVIVVQYIFRFRINYRYLTTLVLFVAGVIVLAFLSRLIPIHLTDDPKHHSWLINFGLMFVSSIALAAALKFLSIKSMQKILREDR
jgi:O-antigen/teichoic acid export membrane protein